MGENDAAALQAFLLILLLSLSLAVVLVGLLLVKTRLWDRNKPPRRKKRQFPNAPPQKSGDSPSATAGRLMILAGAIVGALALVFLIASMAGII